MNLPAARARAADVLRNMVEAGFLTEGQIQTALRNPATPVTRTRDITADYYLDWAFGEIKQMADAGRFRSDRVLTVKTPLDLTIQRKADEVVQGILRRLGDQYEVDEAAMVILDPDGALRAMVGGADYGESQFNRATDALRQPGSSFKPYVYAAGLAAGLYRPDTRVVDRPVCIGNWCPQNYGRSFSGQPASPWRWPNPSTPSRSRSRSRSARPWASPTRPVRPPPDARRSSRPRMPWASPRN